MAQNKIEVGASEENAGEKVKKKKKKKKNIKIQLK